MIWISNPGFSKCTYKIHPGNQDDLDMLQIGNGMTFEEDYTHFIMWCMMSAPLMIGCDLTKLDEDRIRMLSNRELIRIHQDPACLQAYVVRENREEGNEWEIWIKDLGKRESEDKAVVFLNRSSKTVRIRASLEEIGLKTEKPENVCLRNLRNHKELTFNGSLDFELVGRSCIVLRVQAPEAVYVKDLVQSLKSMTFEKLTWEAFSALPKGSYHLLDVRSGEEYARGHLEGAVNIPYTDIHGLPDVRFDKNDRIILYCTTGKRSSQAAKSLVYLGYNNLVLMTCTQFG